jgi:hypothetical protein
MRTILFFLFLTVNVLAQETVDVRLAWDPNPEPDVSEYRLYVGVAHGTYTPFVPVAGLTKTVSLPKDVLHFAVVTAVNTSGLESLPSTELAFQVFKTGEGKVPSAPVGLRKNGPLQVSLEQSNDLKVWQTLYAKTVEATLQDFFRVKLSTP